MEGRGLHWRTSPVPYWGYGPGPLWSSSRKGMGDAVLCRHLYPCTFRCRKEFRADLRRIVVDCADDGECCGDDEERAGHSMNM